MYILEGYVANSFKRIDISDNKQDIISTMIDISNKYDFYNFKITEVNEEKKIPERITSQREFYDYLIKYRERTKKMNDLSCIELKRYILNKKRDSYESK